MTEGTGAPAVGVESLLVSQGREGPVGSKTAVGRESRCPVSARGHQGFGSTAVEEVADTELVGGE